MLGKKMIPLFILMLAAIELKAFELGKDCTALDSCIESFSQVTGDKYLFNTEIKGVVKGIGSIKIDKTNANFYLSSILFDNGYTRIKVKKDTYKIISARDIRYNATPQYSFKAGEELKVPENFDYYMLTYKLKNPEVSKHITRALRPFMSRYGRIIDSTLSSHLIIQDSGNNLNRLAKLVEKMDVKPNPKLLKKLEKEMQMKAKEEKKGHGLGKKEEKKKS